MASKSAILSVRIVGDATSASKAFKKAEDRAKAMQRTFEKSAKIAAGALAGLAAGAWHVAQVASEAEQAAGAVDSIFAGSAKTIKKYAEDASQAVGLSAQSYNELASVLGAQLKNMGMAGSDLTGQTNELIELGADLAATFGGTTASAVESVSSLLRGERDPIEKYGVSIKQADISARLAAMGLEDLEGEAAKAAERQATLAILTEQTAAAQGQFARESDTAAGAQQRATASWEDAQAKLGEALLPALTDLAGMLEKVATWVSENDVLVRNLAVALGVVSAALVVLRGAQIAVNIAMAANPVGLIITAVGLLAAGVAWLVTNWEEVERVVRPIVEGLADAVMRVVEWLKEAAQWVGDVFGGIGSWFGDVFGAQTATVSYVPDTSQLTGSGAFARMTAATASTTSYAPLSARIGPASGSAARATVGDRYEINIHGAIDVDGTARTLETVMTKHARRTGRTSGGTRWR